MISVTPLERLGRFDSDWLQARYHFSFAGYRDAARMGLGALCVWNDDTVRPGTGFDRHSHRDMEIVTYLRSGAITHEDDLGNRGVIRAGEVQAMSAGTGIEHAERNLEGVDTTLFQIWIEPARAGFAPRWATAPVPVEERTGRLRVLVSGRPGDAGLGALPIHQDAAVLGAILPAGQSVAHPLGRGRAAYLVPATGSLEINGHRAEARAGVAVTDEERVLLRALADCELVLVDVAAG